MISRKKGKLFIVLSIALIAFGIGSVTNVLTSDNFSLNDIIPSSLAFEEQEKVMVINDPSFEPVYIEKVVPQPINNTNNTTTNNTSGGNNRVIENIT
ncbi:MAG: hypothetical protein KO217_06275 [Methanobacteriaceae archaeon]|jgi:hypothetical protein|nr:MAG: hypothetical protein CIT01_00890 [Methanobacterium sp. BRmetb2]MCC7558276.1 hypothetical protein [Methanobacteriaceae archaeon]